jgi:GNAT superfamily N-acetyltransferase
VRFFAYHDPQRQPVGFYGLLIEKEPSDLKHLHQKSELMDIAILPEYRNQGFGKIMLAHAEQVARDAELYCMYISTYARDFKVINFYGQNGFVPVATLPDVHGPKDECQVFMRKILRQV